MESGMPIKIYLHRTKKKEYAVCEAFTVYVDLTKLPADKQTDIKYINAGFMNDARRLAKETKSVKKYGTAYISFMRPQYEGPEDKNGTDKVYFDNTEMIFKLKEESSNEE